MNLDRDRVLPINEQRGRDLFKEGRFVGWINGGSGEGLITDGSRGHVVSHDLRAVQIDNRAIVTEQANNEICPLRGVSDPEMFAKIRGDEAVEGIGAETDHGRFVSIPIAEFGRAKRP